MVIGGSRRRFCTGFLLQEELRSLKVETAAKAARIRDLEKALEGPGGVPGVFQNLN